MFVCSECEEKGGFELEEHKKDHSLVRCLKSHEGDHDAENGTVVLTERVSSLESNIQLMNDRLLRVETNVQAMNEKQERNTQLMNDRLLQVETNVRAMNEKLRIILDYIQRDALAV